MRRFITRGLAVAVLAVLLAGLLLPLHAASPFAGKWKLIVTTMPEGVDHALFLIKVDIKPSSSKGLILSTPALEHENAVIDDLKAADKTLSFLIRTSGPGIPVTLNLPEGQTDPKKLLGSCEIKGKRVFCRAERTEEFEIKKDKAESPLPGMEDLRKAQMSTFAADKLAMLKDVLAKFGDTPVAYYARLEMVAALAASGAPEADVKAEIERAVKVTEGFDPGMKSDAMSEALRAEAAGLKTYVAAIKNINKPTELAAAETRLNKLEQSISGEELKANLPFRVQAYKPRKARTDRVTLVELFTGSSCPPCVAADIAFDALLVRFQPSEVVVLQYHMNIPATDPMTVADGETRAEFYDIGGTPTLFINGKEGPALGGGKGQAESSFDRLTPAVESPLESQPAGKLTLTVKRQGNAVDIQGQAADVKGAGDDARLRFVLVEEMIHYEGGNGQKVHHHVVRAFPGGTQGAALKEGKGTHTAKINLEAMGKQLATAVEKLGMSNTEKVAELKRLKVVAFIQNDKTKEVLQAAQADVDDTR